jgi:hypothetical protein
MPAILPWREELPLQGVPALDHPEDIKGRGMREARREEQSSGGEKGRRGGEIYLYKSSYRTEAEMSFSEGKPYV